MLFFLAPKLFTLASGLGAFSCMR